MLCKSEPFLSDDDILLKMKMNINNINGSYVNNI